MPFRKRKILKMIMAEERHLAADLEAYKGGGMPAREYREEVEGHEQRLHELFHRLQPRRPLDWNELFVRLGIAVLLFFLMMAPAYPSIRAQYLIPDVVTKTSGEGDTIVTRVLPIEPIRADDWLTFHGNDRTDSVEVAAVETLAGNVLGVAPDGHGAWVYWLQGNAGATNLFRRYVQNPLSPVKEPALVSASKWVDGALLVEPQGIVFVGTRMAFGKNFALFQRYSVDGSLQGAETEVALNERDESARGLQLFAWNDRYVLLTVRVPIPESTQNRREVVIRVLDSDFSVKRTERLVMQDFHVGYYPAFLPEANGGFSLVFQGKRAVKTSLQEQGDDLYRVYFDDQFQAVTGQRLTSAGLSHDFLPTALIPDGARLLLAAHQAPRPFGSVNRPAAGYPVDTGKAVVYAFDPSWKRVLGSSIVYNEGPFSLTEDMRGAAYLRLAKQGNVLYAAYDLIIPDDPETGRPKHAIRVMKILL